MEKIKFVVAKKQNKKNKQLRREGLIPANLYRAGQESLTLELNNLDFTKLLRKLPENAVLYLQIADEKKELPALIDEVQYDVFGKEILHVIFRQINLLQKIRAEVSVELTGEFDVADGVLILAKDSVEVEALPADVPASFPIDQSQLKAIGDRITLKDLQFDPSKITLILNEDEKAEEIVLALVQAKAEEVVEEETESTLTEPALVNEKTADEQKTSDQDASTK